MALASRQYHCANEEMTALLPGDTALPQRQWLGEWSTGWISAQLGFNWASLCTAQHAYLQVVALVVPGSPLRGDL